MLSLMGVVQIRHMHGGNLVLIIMGLCSTQLLGGSPFFPTCVNHITTSPGRVSKPKL